MGPAEQRIVRKLQAANDHQCVKQLVDGGFTELRIRGMRRASLCPEPYAQHASRSGAESVVGGLAIHQIADACRRIFVRDAGAVAPALLADDEEQRHAPFASCAQAHGRRDLRGQDAFGVARTAAENQPALLATGKERRDTVDVGRQDDDRPARVRGVEIESTVRYRLLPHSITVVVKKAGQPHASLTFSPGCGVDVDQAARKRDGVYRIHRSSSVRARSVTRGRRSRAA